MRYSLVATDLDGTALDKNRRISERNRRAMEAAIEQGVFVVPATGRTFTALPADISDVKGIRYVISSNGAEIRDLEKGGLIYTNYLSAAAVENIIDVLKDSEFMLEVFTGGRAYTDSISFEKTKQGLMNFRNTEYILETRTPVDDLIGFMEEHRDTIENVNVNFSDLSIKPALGKELAKIKGTTLTTSFDHNWELGGATTGKGDALAHLCEILGIEADRCIAVGDSPNDSSMLRFAGLGIAVASGKDELKEMAGYITASNDDDGLAEAIERFVLT